MNLSSACALIFFVALLPACNKAPVGVVDDTAETQLVKLPLPGGNSSTGVLYGHPKATICNFRRANASELLGHMSEAKAYGSGFSYIDLKTKGAGRHRLFFKPDWVHSSADASLVFCSGTSDVGSGSCILDGISARGCFEVTLPNRYTLAQTEQLLDAVKRSYPRW